jgi:hypothetical protein
MAFIDFSQRPPYLPGLAAGQFFVFWRKAAVPL